MFFLVLFRIWLFLIPCSIGVVLFKSAYDWDMENYEKKPFMYFFRQNRKFIIFVVGLPVLGPMFLLKYLKNGLKSDLKGLFNEDVTDSSDTE